MATANEENSLATVSSMLTDLAAKLTAVSGSVGDIKTSIIGKGVQVPDGTKLSAYDTLIDSIETDPDYTSIITQLTALGTTLDQINGEVITASTGS